MKNSNDKIKELRKRLDKLGIETDRDLVKQLGIKQEDKDKLYTWIEYQCAFSFREGYGHGQNDLAESINHLFKKGNLLWNM